MAKIEVVRNAHGNLVGKLLLPWDGKADASKHYCSKSYGNK